jgi:transposase
VLMLMRTSNQRSIWVDVAFKRFFKLKTKAEGKKERYQRNFKSVKNRGLYQRNQERFRFVIFGRDPLTGRSNLLFNHYLWIFPLKKWGASIFMSHKIIEQIVTFGDEIFNRGNVLNSQFGQIAEIKLV